MHPSKDSLTERVNASSKQLSAASVQLNAVSDELGKLIAELEAAIKKLNLGVEAWTRVSGTSSDGGAYTREDLGYAKVDGKWGIALRSVSGHEAFDDSENCEETPFNEAPRHLRIAAIDKIPNLIDKLSAAAEATTKEISGKLDRVREVVTAVSGAAAAPRK